MRVDGREIPVSGDLLQPLTRRTADILRVVLASLFVATVVAGSLITRSQWDALEASVSNIVGVLSPDVSNIVYVLYGIAILALPFGILIGLIAGRQWRLLAGYAAAALLAGITLSITRNGLKAPNIDLEMSSRLDSIPSQLLDDPRWIGALAAVLTVSGPWLPARWRRAWWSLLLLFVPIHLVVSTVVPARSLLGLGTGWLIGAILVLLFGTPALAVPLDAAVRELQANERLNVLGITVLSPAGLGPLVLSAHCNRAASAGETEDIIVELYGQNQRSRGALRQFWRWLSFRSSETAPLHASLRRAVEHRALMDIALTELRLASSTLVALSTLERQWEMFAHTAPRGRLFKEDDDPDVLAKVWASLLELHARQIAHGDLRSTEIRIHDGKAVFGGYAYAELGASKAQIRNDNAQLMLISAAQFGHKQAVHDALAALGQEPVIAAAGRLTRTAQPKRIRSSVPHAGELMAAVREEVGKESSADKIRAEQVTRFSRNQIIQLVLLIALVYVAYPFVSQVPTFVTELRDVNWGWASLGLLISGLTYVGAAAALWACADGLVKFRNTVVMQVANTFAATTTPAGVGGLALSVRFLQKGGLGTLRATAAVALQQVMQVVTHVSLLVAFSIVAGTNTEITNFVPKGTILYLIGGIALGAIGAYTFVPQLRIWLRDEVRPQVAEVLTELAELAKDPRRFALIVGGCAVTTLGAALALWASIEAFGGGTTFVTVTVVTMIGGTLASAAPTPGGVGAVEAALIGGLAAFGLPAAIAVPSVLLYRVLTCWLPVFLGWPILRSMTHRDMV